jgi:hypothetical protein
MSFNYETGGDVTTGSTWLDQPGTYHLNIVDVDESPTNKDGRLIDNAAFRIACTVGDGTVRDQTDKTIDICFFHPKSTDKNGGAMAKKKLDRFFLAVGLLTEKQIRDKEQVSIDLQEANGRQFVAKLDKEKEDAKFLSLSFADIFHVDDPAVAAVPKYKGLLSLIAPSLRLIGMPTAAQQQAAAKPASNGKRETQAATPAPEPAGVAAGSSFDDL